MKHDRNYYTELKTYELKWEGYKLGFELTDVQRMVYNPCIKAEQEIVSCDGIRTMTVKVTEAVMDTMRRVLSFKEEKMLG